MRNRTFLPSTALLLLSLLVPLTGCDSAENMVGKTAPPIQVAGWVNGRPESVGGLVGQVTVLDFGASS
ncbi:MAG: hypothetical protein ACC645_12235 [Pirellulales bacterium]